MPLLKKAWLLQYINIIYAII